MVIVAGTNFVIGRDSNSEMLHSQVCAGQGPQCRIGANGMPSSAVASLKDHVIAETLSHVADGGQKEAQFLTKRIWASQTNTMCFQKPQTRS